MLNEQEATIQQIKDGEKLLFHSLEGDQPTSSNTVADAQKINALQNALECQLELIEHLSAQLMPSETLFINVIPIPTYKWTK